MKAGLPQTSLNQILLDNMPCVALLLRRSTREIVASNQAAVKVGAVPGTHCFATWGQRDKPCPWCLAPELWKTGQAQHLEVEAPGVVWDAHWVPVGPDLYLHYAFDITERKRMEEALRNNDQTLRTLLNAVPESIFLIDADRKIVAANETLAQRLGKDLDELVGTRIAEILPNGVAKNRKDYADEVFRTGQALRFEDVREGRNFDNLLYPVLDADGQVSRAAVFSLDITERRQAEKALRESEQRYRSLFENMLEGFAYCRMFFDGHGRPADWVYLEVNKAFDRLTGLKNIVGKRVTEVIPEIKKASPELFEIYGRVSMTGQPEKFEFFFKPLSMWLNVTAYSPAREYFVAVFEDITDRKQAEEALRASLRFLKIAHNQKDVNSLLKTFVSEVKEFTGCEAVGIRLLNAAGDIPYQAYCGFSKQFYELESLLSIKTDQCMCINVIKGTCDPQFPFYTPGGSFYINGTTRFLATVSEEDKGNTRNVCNQEGYESVALIPFRHGDRILGLIHVADRRENLVPLEKVEILEKAGMQLGTALVRLQTEEALRDKEKFLSDVFNSIQDGLTILDPQLNIIRVNPAMERFGYNGPIIGRKCYDAYHGRSEPCLVCPVRQTLGTGEASREIVTEHLADGPDRFMEIFAFPLQDRTSGQVRAVIEYVRDVTDRLTMEQALRDSEKKYHDLYNLTRLIVDNVPDLIWAKGIDNEFILVNQAICQKLLMIDRPEEALGKPHSYFAEKERLAGMEHDFGDTCGGSDEVIKQTRTSGRFLESGVVRGQKIVLDVYKAPLFNEAGDLIGTVGCGRDVTREQEIEEALRQSEEKYRLLVKQIPAVVFRGYPDWSVDYFDDKIEALTGYNREDFQARRIKWRDLIPEEDLDYVQQKFIQALKTDKSYIREHRLRRKDGELIWVQCRGQIFCDESGKINHISGVSFDVTDRKRVELALQESQQTLANIIDFLPDATLVIDKDGKVIAWNRAMEKMTGIKAEDMLGKGNYEHALPFYGKRRPMLINLVLKPGKELALYTGLQREELSLSGVIHLPSFREKEVYHFTKAGVLRDSQGNIIGAIESIRDITDRWKAEAERLRFSKLESLGLLAGGIAHDFNNILTAIIGNISLARLDRQLEDQVHERLKEAEIACQQAQTLARQLLTFAKGGAPVKKITSLTTIIDESVLLSCRGSQVRCTFQAPDDLWLAEADPGQISQVLQNLLINAIQAMPAGGKIEIRAANVGPGATGEAALKPARYVKITIRDQGLGIPAEYLQKIFDPYFTTKQSGSGLGLATAYSIIKNHRGEISVESTMGVGTTFTIYLPASDQTVIPRQGPDKVLLGGKGKILAMDDEPMVRQVLAKMLVNLGYKVELAQDGAEALEKYAEAHHRGEKFAAVILDLTVPGGLGGKDTMAKLLEIDPQVKAIVSSGYSDDPIMADPQKYGFSGVIAKPYKVMELSEILHEILANDGEP